MMFQSMQTLRLLIERMNRLEDAVFDGANESDLTMPEDILHDKLLRLSSALGPVFGSLTFNKDTKVFSSEMTMNQMSFLVGHLMDTLLLMNESMKEHLNNLDIAQQTTTHMQAVINVIQDDDDTLCVKDMLEKGQETEVKIMLASHIKETKSEAAIDSMIDLFADLSVKHAMLMTHSPRIMSLAYDIVETSIGGRQREIDANTTSIVEKTRISDKVTRIQFSNQKKPRPTIQLAQG